LPPRGDTGSGAASGGKGQASAEGASGSPGAVADNSTGRSKDAGGLQGGTPVTAPVEGVETTGDVPIPPDVGDGSDDDVVAHQLREAAMKEKDPDLRAKLWDEYREYKKSAGKGGS
jgi:hypothetical protein